MSEQSGGPMANKDGEVIMLLSPDGYEVQASVTPPEGSGKPVDFEFVIKLIRENRYDRFLIFEERIRELVSGRKFGFTTIAQKRDGAAQIDVTSDFLEATLTISKAYGGQPVTETMILNALESKGITSGVDRERIRNAIQQEMYDMPIVVAQGTPPMDGEDAAIEFLFDTEKKIPRPTIHDDGAVDFKELNLVDMVKQGQVLVRKRPLKTGQNGVNLRGDVLQAKLAHDMPLPMGKNVEPAPTDPDVLVAMVPGQPKLVAKKVHVLPVLEIKGDVDLSTGNINFTGDVLIRGSVISGFTIKTLGNVEIHGSVEGAIIEAGGDIFVSKGIHGQGEGFISTRGNLRAKFIDNVTVIAEGSVFVDEAIMFSKVNCFHEVILGGKKGFIIGGVVRAGTKVTARQIGSDLATMTVIEVGGNPNIRDEMEEIQSAVDAFSEKSKNLERSVETLKKSHQKDTSFDERKKEKLLMATREQYRLIGKVKTFLTRKHELNSQLKRLTAGRFSVNVSGIIYTGVKITVKTSSMKVDKGIENCTIYEKDDKLQISPFRP